MFNLSKNSPHTAKLVSFLQDANPKSRLVTYYAIAEYVVPYLIKDLPTERLLNKYAHVTVPINHVVYKLNELAIIDKELLTRIFNNVLQYKLHNITSYSFANNNLIEASCFQDILGITKFYTAEDIHTINTNFNLFKQVVVTVVEILNENKEALVASEVAPNE